MDNQYDLEIGSTPSVFSHRNNPAVTRETAAELTQEGIGIVDWGMGLSGNYKEVAEDHRTSAKRAFEAILRMN